MNREIKFRGKSVTDGTWVYGSYHYSNDGKHHYILAREKFFLNYDTQALHKQEVFEVIPETVGQFTGLTDKNGKEIYEGDIVNAAFKHHGIPGTKFKAYIIYNEHIGSFRIAYDSLGGGSQDEIYFRYEIEVIGNVFENLDLLTHPTSDKN